MLKGYMVKDFDRWNEAKKQTDKSIFNDFVHARDVWWCALGVNVGVKQDGKHDTFERPILVLRKFNKDMVLAVPLSTRIKKNPYNVIFTHEGEEFSALISQVRIISTKRLKRYMYKMSSNIFDEIREKTKTMI
ncbi:MAG: type II toxin-antitoxin system PemK/MazF family toxin [bacterium]|nr:type II toxin-antitoxin system PemK/MazF family toxin [bacterium]